MPKAIAPPCGKRTEDAGSWQNPKPTKQGRSKNAPPKQEREQRSDDSTKNEANLELESI